MSLIRPAMYDNGQQRLPNPGDMMALAETISANSTVGATTILASQLLTGILNRTGSGGAFADTLPTAANLVNALLSQTFLGGGAYSPVGIPPGTTFRMRYINAVAFIDTITAPDNTVTLGSNTAIAASSVKDFLFTILNGTPPQVWAGNTTNANAVVTGMSAAQTQTLTVGMVVSGTGITAGTLIASIQPGVGFTLSANATATNTQTALTFNPQYRVDSLGQMLL